jgi:transcriptional regulator with XRE-family HTH domain
MIKIGNKLKGIRVEKGYTTVTMADKLGISDPTYRKYETDKSFPDIMMLDKIAKALDKNFTDFLPNECFVQNNNDQKGGVTVNLGTINQLSEKLIEQYEARLKEKDERLKEKDAIIEEMNKRIKELEDIIISSK